MNVFFIGTVHFSRKMLEVLIQMEEIKIVGIATKSKSELNSDHTDLSDIAGAMKIPFKYVRDINAPHILKWIHSLNPEIVFCFGWSFLIKNELIKLAENGVIGYHPSKLPQNRGRHPLIWALVLGLEETASTFFRMDESADSGDICSQKLVKITKKDTAKDLYNKMIKIAEQQLYEFVPKLKNDTINWKKQNNTEANTWRKRAKADGEIDFRMTSSSIYNLVRALTRPYIGAHLKFGDEEIKVWSCEIGPNYSLNIEPGKILKVRQDKRILVKSGDSSVWLKEHEFTVLPEVNKYIL